MPTRIATILDDDEITAQLRTTLNGEGWQVISFSRGSEGLDYLSSRPVDLALVDMVLPDLTGLRVCQALRAGLRTHSLPVMFLTAKEKESDRLAGFDAGADDYVVKPFSPRELLARMKAILRRGRPTIPEPPEVIEVGDVRLDVSTHEVVVRGKAIELTALESGLLRFLMTHPGRVFSRERLVSRVWGSDRCVARRSVDYKILNLRVKVEADPGNPRHIQTLRGSGYVFRG